MNVSLSPEIENRLNDLATASGCSRDQLMEAAMADYLDSLMETRSMLDRRYDDMVAGKVEMLSPEEARILLEQKSEERRAKRK